MNPTQKKARIAGVLYLLLVFTGLFNLMYVPSKLIVRGDAAATAGNILAHQTLFRVDIAVSVVSTVIFMILVLALYRLLKDVNRPLAKLMVILVLVQLPQSFVSQLLQIGTLELVRGADFLTVLDQSQRDVWAMMCIHLSNQTSILAEIFWGIWLFPLGVLVYRSGFLPRIVGVWLIINGTAYVVMCFTGLLLPEYYEVVSKYAFPALLGELALTLWLLIIGVKPKPAAG